MQMYFFFPEQAKPGTAVFKKLVERMRAEKIFQAIVVVQLELHPIAKKAVSEIQRTAIFMDVFQVDFVLNSYFKYFPVFSF